MMLFKPYPHKNNVGIKVKNYEADIIAGTIVLTDIVTQKKGSCEAFEPKQVRLPSRSHGATFELS